MIQIKLNMLLRNKEERNPCTVPGSVGNYKTFVDWKDIGERKNIIESDRNWTKTQL